MIGKVVRGNDIGGLFRYLFGPGRANEHNNPHIVAAWDEGVVATYAPGSDPRLKRLTALLDQPLAALDYRPSPAVWHCPLRTAPGDRQLTDAQWADVAAEVLHQTGLAPRGDSSGCRWVAVRHADDHIHLAVTLARQDGRQARTSHDYARLGAACRTVEERYGLTKTPARDRTAPKRPTRAEVERAHRERRPQTSREQLRGQVRRAALASTDLDDFVNRLQESGVMVRLRFSQQDPRVVTGYSVADGRNRSASGSVIWFGGAKLAPQLSLPRLASTWTRPPSAFDTRPSSRSPGRRSDLAMSLGAAARAASYIERGQLGAAAASLVILSATRRPR